MFDSGGISGKLAQAHALLAGVAAHIDAELSGPAAREAFGEALPAMQQLELVTCLLSERVDRSGEFAADNAVSMAAWLRNEARSTRATKESSDDLTASLDAALAAAAAECTPKELRDLAVELLERFAPEQQERGRERIWF